MPIYEFSCPECGEAFDELVDAGTSAHPCPSCGAEAERRFASIAPMPKLGKQTRTEREARRRRIEGRRERKG